MLGKLFKVSSLRLAFLGKLCKGSYAIEIYAMLSEMEEEKIYATQKSF